MSSSSRARRGGSLQFPVGRSWRHVAVVDAGCGCRPRRATTRLLSQLPSFLRPSPKPAPQQQQPPLRSSSRSSSGFFPSSASTASSASAATFTTTHSSYSNYSAYSSYNNLPTAAAAATAAVTKHPAAASKAAATSRRRQQGAHHLQGRRKQKRYEKMAAAAESAAGGEDDGDVGVAVEKESSDPRADFRESMVQMVVEMGLCGWDDLRCMLRRLLALNAPRHHPAILAAFAEVCAQLTAPPPAPSPQPAYQYHAYDYHYHY